MTISPKKKFTTQVAVDVVVFSVIQDALSVLLITRQWEPFDTFASLPGAFLVADETTLDAAQRVLREKVGITTPIYMEQLYTFDTNGRDPRGHFPTVTYLSLVTPNAVTFQEAPTTQQPTWQSVENLPRLAFDHAMIIQEARKRIQSKFEYTNLASSLLPARFTLTQLQRIYEIVLGHALDKRNFRKKYLSLGFIQPTSAWDRGGKQRPARLYQFKSSELLQLQKFI